MCAGSSEGQTFPEQGEMPDICCALRPVGSLSDSPPPQLVCWGAHRFDLSRLPWHVASSLNILEVS